MSSKRAFTLIELLVVVAIIALLIAILLPSLKRAKDQARTTICLNNLRQLATAFNVYSNDHNNCLPGSTNDSVTNPDGTVERKCWLGTYNGGRGDVADEVPELGTIYPYVAESADLYKCPQDAIERVAERGAYEYRWKTLYSYTGPKLLTGAPVDLLMRTRWVEVPPENNYLWRRAIVREQTTGFSLPWILVEEDESWHLNYSTDSAWSNDDRLTNRHNGQAAIAMLDASAKLLKQPEFPPGEAWNAWRVFYELRDGRFVVAGNWTVGKNPGGGGPIRMGYLKNRGLEGEATLP
jgi:prepilin-type N-terminal cleavage/methylation domain-containing protein